MMMMTTAPSLDRMERAYLLMRQQCNNSPAGYFSDTPEWPVRNPTEIEKLLSPAHGLEYPGPGPLCIVSAPISRAVRKSFSMYRFMRNDGASHQEILRSRGDMGEILAEHMLARGRFFKTSDGLVMPDKAALDTMCDVWSDNLAFGMLHQTERTIAALTRREVGDFTQLRTEGRAAWERASEVRRAGMAQIQQLRVDLGLVPPPRESVSEVAAGAGDDRSAEWGAWA